MRAGLRVGADQDRFWGDCAHLGRSVFKAIEQICRCDITAPCCRGGLSPALCVSLSRHTCR